MCAALVLSIYYYHYFRCTPQQQQGHIVHVSENKCISLDDLHVQWV